MNNHLKYIGLILLLGLLYFFPLLGNVHLFDWDEINFAESSREMLLTGNYFQVTINYEPFWEKPPLFFWLQGLSMHAFGINSFAARLPNAIFGVGTLLMLYFMGRKHYNERFGLIWALLYFGSFLPHIYFKSGIIDPVFNTFIFLSVYFLFRALHKDKHPLRFAVLAGFFSGLAVLTKGPVGFLILLLTFLIYIVIKRFRVLPHISQILLFGGSLLVTSSLWYGAEMIQHGPWFIVEFVKYQVDLLLTPVAGHQQPFYYHFLVVFLGCFPLSVFAIPAFFKRYESEKLDTRTWMAVLFWVVMILFTIVETKIVHYSSMAYLPLSFMAAKYVANSSFRIPYVSKYSNWLFLVLGVIISLALTALPLLASWWKPELIATMKDPFAAASFSNPEISWSGAEFLIGLFYLAAVIFAGWLLFNKFMIRGLIVISVSTGLCLMGYLYAVVPKIEGYTQGPAIEFYEDLQGQDVYVTTLGYKSYAHYFYARVQPPKPGDGLTGFKSDLLKKHDADTYNALPQEEKMDFNNSVNEWLLHGEIDKPVYFSTKITFPDIEIKGVEKVSTRGGFKFYRRLP